MKKEWAIKLRDALKSGEYHYTKGMLGIIKPDGTQCNCAGGVLCRLAGIPSVTVATNVNNTITLEFAGARAVFPPALKDITGITMSEEGDIVDANDMEDSYDGVIKYLEDKYAL